MRLPIWLFSLDSVTTAIALSQEIFCDFAGGHHRYYHPAVYGRFIYIRWLEEFERLEDAGFITVAFVGIRLLTRVMNPELVPSDWVMVVFIAVVFMWGFSKRVEVEAASAGNSGIGSSKWPWQKYLLLRS